MNYKVGDKVWVRCVGTDVWSIGEVTGITAKRIRVMNELRGIEGLYSPRNVIKEVQ